MQGVGGKRECIDFNQNCVSDRQKNQSTESTDGERVSDVCNKSSVTTQRRECEHSNYGAVGHTY